MLYSTCTRLKMLAPPKTVACVSIQANAVNCYTADVPAAVTGQWRILRPMQIFFIVCYVEHAVAVCHTVDILAPLGQYGCCATVLNTRAFRAVISAVIFCKKCYRVQCTVKLFFTKFLYCTVKHSCKNILRTDCGGSQEHSFADPPMLSTGESAEEVTQLIWAAKPSVFGQALLLSACARTP